MYLRKSKKLKKKSQIRVKFNFNLVHSAKDCKQRIRLKNSEKLWKMHTFKKRCWKKRNSNLIKLFLKKPMTSECVSQCISLGRLSQFLDSKDLKAEIGIINIEGHYMFIPLRKNQLNKKLTELSNIILNSIKVLVKVFRHFQKDI